MKANVYLYYGGNCAEAIELYKKALGIKVESLTQYKDAPYPSDPEKGHYVMHTIFYIGETMCMASDVVGDDNFQLKIGNNLSIAIDFASLEELNKSFEGLSEGGKIIMPVQKTFWNAYYGILEDKFGINWMFNYDIKE